MFSYYPVLELHVDRTGNDIDKPHVYMNGFAVVSHVLNSIPACLIHSLKTFNLVSSFWFIWMLEVHTNEVSLCIGVFRCVERCERY